MEISPEILDWHLWESQTVLDANRWFLAEVQKRNKIHYQIGYQPKANEEAQFAIIGHYFAYDQRILRYAYIDHLLPNKP